jgi:hypothetical protein
LSVKSISVKEIAQKVIRNEKAFILDVRKKGILMIGRLKGNQSRFSMPPILNWWTELILLPIIHKKMNRSMLFVQKEIHQKKLRNKLLDSAMIMFIPLRAACRCSIK